MNPIIGLITSQPFIAAVVGLLVNILVAAAPGLETIRTELMTSITVIVGLLVAGLAYTEGEEAKADAAASNAEAASYRVAAPAAAAQYAGKLASYGAAAMAEEEYADNTRMVALLAIDDVLSGDGMDFAKARQRVHELIAAEARSIG